MNKKVELLAPVSDIESLNAAIDFGANSVYLGSTNLGMRKSAGYFTKQLLHNAVSLCHASNVKTYITFNIIPIEEDMESIKELIEMAESAGVDGYIVSDLGIFMEIKKNTDNANIHISTQAGITNHKTANAFYELGAKRVVLARELNLEQIKTIREKSNENLDIECFVHGSMCVSYSGRCLLSQYFTSKDANRGECTQPCRWKYHLMESNRIGEYYSIKEDQNGTYILNAYDLCLIEYLDKLAKVGVNCFKIEGRAKSSYYVATVINAYRQAIDMLSNDQPYSVPKTLIDELDKVSHRPYGTGFLFGKSYCMQNLEYGGYTKKFNFVARVEETINDLILCVSKNKIELNDTVELIEPRGRTLKFKVSNLFNINKDSVNTINIPHTKFYIKTQDTGEKDKIRKGSIIRKAN